jgi:hypothetical protein
MQVDQRERECGGAEEGKVMAWWCFERRRKKSVEKDG